MNVHWQMSPALLVLAGISIMLGSCGLYTNAEATVPTSPPSHLPVIKADMEHLQVEKGDGSVPPFYDVPAGDGFVLDTSELKLVMPPSLKIDAPNMIQIVIDKRYYGAAWETSRSSYVLTAETLTPMQGSRPFDGLKRNEKVVIAIGYMDEKGQTTGQVAFYPMWYAIADVR